MATFQAEYNELLSELHEHRGEEGYDPHPEPDDEVEEIDVEEWGDAEGHWEEKICLKR